MKKLMIVQWAGPLPAWTPFWLANTQRVTEAGHGWYFLLDSDLESIRRSIRRLGIQCPPLEGRKLCDYRPALGEMYPKLVGSFDFFGHTDLDCVYGPLWEYVTDDLLADCDVYSNDPEPDMCGPFSLYRTSTASHVFRQHDNWQRIFEDPAHHAFDEVGISWTLANSGLRVTHRHFEGPDSMYIHFHQPKEYPDLQGWPWAEELEVAV